MAPSEQAQHPPRVGVVMGSRSDWETMRHAVDVLRELGVIIAGAGGAAHLPGMMASLTILPVLGVPIESKALRGVDSLLSIVQMPRGVPVGTLAIGPAGAANAALLAAAILARQDPAIRAVLDAYRRSQTESVAEAP